MAEEARAEFQSKLMDLVSDAKVRLPAEVINLELDKAKVAIGLNPAYQQQPQDPKQLPPEVVTN